MRRSIAPVLLGVTLTLAAGPALAAPFDLIYSDQIDVTLCSGCGITKVALGFALLVNTGTQPLTQQDLDSIEFTCAGSEATVTMTPFLNEPGPPLAPIAPAEALGSVVPPDPNYPSFSGNQLLLDLVAPGETFRNTAPLQVFAFEIDRFTGTYVGPATYDIQMMMSGHVATFTIHADVHLGDFGLMLTHAARVSAVPASTPAKKMTWGRLKRMFE